LAKKAAGYRKIDFSRWKKKMKERERRCCDLDSEMK
jgi:hypothetical protein